MSETTLTTAEACAVLGVDQDVATLLMAGPFAAEDGNITLRQALGSLIILRLPMIRGEDAVRIALSASQEARSDSRRILAVGWRQNLPCGCWLDGDMSASDLGTPLLALPADYMLATLETRLAQHRAMTARPN